MYKIKVIAHQLKNGKIAPFGTLVSLNELNGNADTLIKQGFIEKVEEKVKTLNKTTSKKK